MFAVDAGSTESLAQMIQKHSLRGKGVKGGGFDLTPNTQKLLAGDQIDFTIDQQPYLQGFLPVLQLFMYKASRTLTGLADTDTGLKFLDKTTVVPYNSTKSRYEGTSSAAGRRQGLGDERGSAGSAGPGGAAGAPAAPAPGPPARGARARAAVPDAARGQHHRRHDRWRRSTSR